MTTICSTDVERLTAWPEQNAYGWEPALFEGLPIPGIMRVDPVTAASTYSTDSGMVLATRVTPPAASPAIALPPSFGGVTPAPAVEGSRTPPNVHRPKYPSTLTRWKALWSLMKSCRAGTVQEKAMRAVISPDTATKIIALAEAEGWP